ncbi:MAG: hypothetical protein IT449_11100 [Phycisphaerales bacterium]|nr:hypothetical protein [Phycisphaerales bacterium]
MPDSRPCLICGHERAQQTPLQSVASLANPTTAMLQNNLGTLKCWCKCCGQYAVSRVADQALRTPAGPSQPELRSLQDQLRSNAHKLQALIAEHQSRKLPTPYLLFDGESFHETYPLEPFTAITFEEFLNRWPSTVADRFDRILQNLGRVTSLGRGFLTNDSTRDDLRRMCFAPDDGEARGCLSALIEEGVLQEPPNSLMVVITSKGWRRIDELERTRANPRQPAFVAMWFGDDSAAETQAFMSDLYQNHILMAVEEAGYKADRVDLRPHNDFVMDQVMGMIRVAPFAVADFTGHRGGVYFESGFARGLGIPVIHTCRESHFPGRHFDVQQINTIKWQEPDQLREKLYHRIVGTLGFGPYKRTP